MTIKRKRSSDSLSSDFSPSSRDSSTSPPAGLSNNIFSGHHIPIGCHSRTLKRWRNKPSEESVHEYTLNKLFAAQRNLPTLSTMNGNAFEQPPSPSPLVQTQTQVLNTKPHPFFSSFVNNAPAKLHTPMVQMGGMSLCCEDCDRQIETNWDDEEGEAFACRNFGCGKRVCDLCSVVDGERRCLECVTGR